MTRPGVDGELLAVLVSLEPLDNRKWDYLNLTDRTFHADRMIDEQAWSSGERVLINLAASLWNSGTVDLGYIACALGDRHLQAVIDATALRAGHNLTSNIDRAVAQIGGETGSAVGRERGGLRRACEREKVVRLDSPPSHGLGR